jgi:hypothetical protein
MTGSFADRDGKESDIVPPESGSEESVTTTGTEPYDVVLPRTASVAHHDAAAAASTAAASTAAAAVDATLPPVAMPASTTIERCCTGMLGMDTVSVPGTKTL